MYKCENCGMSLAGMETCDCPVGVAAHRNFPTLATEGKMTRKMKYKVIVSIPTGPKSSLHQGLTIDAEHPPVIGDRVTLEGDIRPWTVLAVIKVEAARNLDAAEKKLAEHGISWEDGKGYVFNPPSHAENCVCFQCQTGGHSENQ